MCAIGKWWKADAGVGKTRQGAEQKTGVREMAREREIMTCQKRHMPYLLNARRCSTQDILVIIVINIIINASCSNIISTNSSNGCIISISIITSLPGEWSRSSWCEPQSSRSDTSSGCGDHSAGCVQGRGHLPGWRVAWCDDGGAGEKTGQRAWNEHHLEEGWPWHPHLRHCEYSIVLWSDIIIIHSWI